MDSFNDPNYVSRLRHLFKPGPGIKPPYLAGREQEEAILTDFLEGLGIKTRTPADIILYGPRGNGKTVLMKHFRDLAEQRNKPGGEWLENNTKIINIKASEVKTIPELAFAIQGTNLIEKTRVKLPFLDVDFTTMNRDAVRATLGRTLQDVCRRNPILITLDEAHTLDKDVGAYLLNMSQTIREEGAPFLLTLAGTPGLREHLEKMNASFWSRSKKIPIGRVNSEAAGQALTAPLNEMNIDVEEEALGQVVEDCQNYPYFIQLWGDALCKQAIKHKEKNIKKSNVKEAMPAVEYQRRDYYQDRYNELREQELLDTAAWVSRQYTGHTTQNYDAMARQLAETMSIATGQALDRMKILKHLGYLWEPGGGAPCEPGIPSLMTYVKDEVQITREALGTSQ